MWQLTPNLNGESKDPLYIQLYLYIKHEIKSGSLVPDMKLPSKRKFAQHLSVSQNTVETAYGQLVAEGYIESRPRKGYFVSPIDEENFSLPRDVHHVEEKPCKHHGYTYNFAYTGVDFESFPLSLYRKLMNEVLRSDNKEIFQLGHPQGEFELRKLLSEYVYEARGVRCSPSQIIIGSGTQTLLKLLFQLLPHSKFAVEDPGYHRKVTLFEKKETQVELIPIDSDGMLFSNLKGSSADVAIVTPSHQFPCGMIMPVSRRLQLLKWAREEEDRYIIEDDYDSEFRYSGKPIPALQGLDTGENVIYMGTFSKALLPSLRISYMVLPASLIKTYQNEFFFYTQTVSRIDQKVLKKFLKRGHWERHIQKMKMIYRKKRDVLIDEIAQYFPETVEVIGQDSGLHLMLRLNNGMTEQEAIDRAAKLGIKVNAVSEYGKNDGQTVIMGFAVLTTEQIKAGVKLLAKAWFD
ncbi:PLP-dependent aminotransferase family protein [Alkalihalobacillus hwajinpoensis]|uniref:MocR-like pyridoxine biosynthesis transcription factor PdxR n=1 Tax=Guptibacillus hwajinpoensis TaxID=208199 RepID=UPI0018842491|nr:PLP-dependent aminotransferase family protein [Pseudalkalibacillus hwajinpoensis]MBF0705819.1 PLP-dependent aminotransferase family protein [Pseudalkalibacillus hwajinpoensis]